MPEREQVVCLLKERRPYLHAEFGVSRVALFGSVASDQSGPSSDVDILVEFDRPIGFRFVELSEYLEELLGCKVDILTPAGIRSIRQKQIADSITAGLVDV